MTTEDAEGQRRHNAPLLTPGTHVVLPAGITAIAVKDYYHPSAPGLGQVRMAALDRERRQRDGERVDRCPSHGAPTRVAILSGFTEGWYELSHASGTGRPRHVGCPQAPVPVVLRRVRRRRARLRSTAGSTRSRCEPFSRNPYSRKRSGHRRSVMSHHFDYPQNETLDISDTYVFDGAGNGSGPRTVFGMNTSPYVRQAVGPRRATTS